MRHKDGNAGKRPDRPSAPPSNSAGNWMMGVAREAGAGGLRGA